MKQKKQLIVLVGPDRQQYKLDNKIIPLWEKTDIIRLIYENLQAQEPIELDQNKTSKYLMDLMVQYLQMHDYKPPQIQLPFKKENLVQCLDPKDYNFIKSFTIEGKELPKLCDFAHYMQMRPLFKLCCARVAIELYCGQNFENYLKVKSKLGITKSITYEDYSKMKQKYKWIED